MKLSRILTNPVSLFLVFLVFPAVADEELTARMRIGNFDEQFAIHRIDPDQEATFSVANPGEGGYFLLRWIIADDLEGHAYDFQLRHNDVIVTHRAGTTSGFGRRSSFIPVNWPGSSGKKEISLVISNHSREPLNIEALSPLPKFDEWLNTPPAKDDFRFSLLVSGDGTASRSLQQISKLEQAPGVVRGISSELQYAKLSAEDLRRWLETLKSVCENNDLYFLAVTCSWWSGTPKEVFERPEFQQVCFSETDTHEAGPALKKLLGDAYDKRYGWSIPNMWSNTPWQTMNHPELNKLRHGRLKAAVAVIEDVMKDRLAGYVAENEPAYWAFPDADYLYPVKRERLWADFNPSCVEAAKKDGVILDPKDGLELKERMWLHQNLTNYMQDNIDVLQGAKASGTLYSHALLSQMFPLQGTGHYHPYAETARVRNAHVGLETLWKMDADALWRLREWGPWACVNREENDGVGFDYHIAMLELEYILGAELYNSYNWDAVNEDNRCIAYMNTFMKSLRSGGKVVAGFRQGGNRQIDVKNWSGPLEIRPEFPWFNQVELGLKAGENAGNLMIWITRGVGGDTVALRTINSDQVSTEGLTLIDFGDIAILPQEQSLTLHVTGNGWTILSGNDGPDFILSCDMRKERRRSQYLIGKAAK